MTFKGVFRSLNSPSGRMLATEAHTLQQRYSWEKFLHAELPSELVQLKERATNLKTASEDRMAAKGIRDATNLWENLHIAAYFSFALAVAASAATAVCCVISSIRDTSLKKFVGFIAGSAIAYASGKLLKIVCGKLKDVYDLYFSNRVLELFQKRAE